MKDETTGNASDSSFILHPSSFVFRNGPVVQRQRPLAYTQVTMVRVHPGSLGLQVLWRHSWVVRRKAGFKSRADL